jgi:omega-6 fatty acid desaturase (delta-12 desaturase)
MNEEIKDARPAWLGRIKDFEGPVNRSALIQLVNTVLPYLAGLALMFASRVLDWPIWVTLILALPTGAFMVRTFILFHDCCHGSFVSSRKLMETLGFVLGVLVFTPFRDWRRTHWIHHNTVGNLDKRGLGDVWTMTVEEYKASPASRRFLYRFYRNPITLFIFGPFFTFILTNRFPTKGSNAAQHRELIFHNLALFAVAAILSLAFGFWNYVLIQGSVIFLGGIVGIWMFYVQHQFDPSYWEHGEGWSFIDAALVGSSWYRLPKVLQWLTGNIGLHHIHHLSPRIPNYRLQACLDSIPELREKTPLRLARSLRAISLNLWDEKGGGLISFRRLRRLA